MSNSPLAGVSRATSNDHSRLEDSSIGLKLVVVNVASLRVDTVGKGLEVDGSGGHSLTSTLSLAVRSRVRQANGVGLVP